MCTTSDQSGRGQDPLKSLKLNPKEKTRKAITTSLKGAATIILITSVLLALYSAFQGSTRPEFFRRTSRPDPEEIFVTQFDSDWYPTNISHIAFGIGGSTATWENRALYSDLWFKPGLTRGFVFLEKKGKPRSGIESRVSSEWKQFRRTAGSEAAVRLARVAVDLFRAGLPNVRWLVMGDDDTVFFPENLAAVLGKYDHRRMVYVGGNSESVEQDVMHAYDMAFGGGGFAVSYPLAAALAGAMDGCLDRYHYFYGSDQRVWACIGELGVGLTREPGFHQIDIRGDPFGLLAAHPLAPLVSLHHLDSVDPLFPNHTQLDSLTSLVKAYEADPSRTLQQSFGYYHKHNWSVSVSWGYTVQIFPGLLTAKELETPQLTFKTWRSWSDGPFTFNTRPVSPDPCQRPVAFFLSSVKQWGTRSTETTYKRFHAVPEKRCVRDFAHADAIENVVVSASRMEPHDLSESPRRQCCDMNVDLKDGTVRIRVRRCKRMESIQFEGSLAYK